MLDGEVGNSTYTEDVEAVAPERFFQLYIAEQCMVGVQTGLQALGKTAFAATFGAFLTRAADQIRMGAISRADLRLCGSHAGVSIGEDGPSQMAVEDLAMFRALNGSTVLYPADGHEHGGARRGDGATSRASPTSGRPGRRRAPCTPPTRRSRSAGRRRSPTTDHDDVTLVGAGITLHACLAAHDVSGADGITARVIDCYSVKPIDAATLRRAMDDTGALVVVEDHRVEGGLGDAVLDALAATGPLARARREARRARRWPGRPRPSELRAWAGIDAASIAARGARGRRPARTPAQGGARSGSRRTSTR